MMRFDEHFENKKTTVAGFEPAREIPTDFKSVALTTRPYCLSGRLLTFPFIYLIQSSLIRRNAYLNYVIQVLPLLVRSFYISCI